MAELYQLGSIIMRALSLLFILIPTIAIAQTDGQTETLIQSLEAVDNMYMLIGISFILGAITMAILLIILDVTKERREKKK
jgi:O-antigen/teichoic acid export membrane protein